MSLSYYPNCPASHDDHLNSDEPPPTMLDHLLTPPPPDNNFNDFYNHHQLFDPNDLFYTSENPNHFPNEFPNFDCGAKLQKHYPDHRFVDVIDPVFFDDGLFPNLSYDYYAAVGPESTTTLPEFLNGPPGYSNGIFEGAKERSTGLSAQSIVARQRRRKITEKTRELRKLVPGGQKMNTAEMLQAAYKYIKFLQAQVGILEFARSYRETSADNDKLHDLLVSEAIQEKLYSTEKCVVPSRFVEEISADDRIVGDIPQLVSIIKHEV